MKIHEANTTRIVILGYCILIALAISGFVTIYLEIPRSLKILEHPVVFKQELIDLNNTLSSMYQAEGTVGFLSVMSNDDLMHKYDSLMHNVFAQITVMKSTSNNLEVFHLLDSLYVLMVKKQKNAKAIFELMKSIENNTVKEITQTSISAWNDIDELNKSLINKTYEKEDTSFIIADNKGLFQRIKEAVTSSQPKTLIQVNKSKTTEIDELSVPVKTDTLRKSILKINLATQKKNASIIRKMLAKQNDLYQINELSGLKIHQILAKIENLEFENNLHAQKEKNKVQTRSTIYVALIGLIAIVIALFFMTWTLKSLKEGQRLHKKAKDAKKKVERLLFSREQLIYSITHDIKAPIGSIIGFLDLMTEEKLSVKQQYYIDNMNSSASHIVNLVKNLLDFQHLENNQPQLNKTSFLPFLLMNDIYKSFLPLAGKKKMTFELNQLINEESQYLGDPYLIRNILNNVISNAVKYTPENGKIVISTSIENDELLTVSVKDNGPGIGEKDKTHIFEAFVRLENTKKMTEGAGLGLTIAQTHAVWLGGNISIESQVGQGSDFIFTVPLTSLSDKTSFDNPIEKKIPHADFENNIHILFIDDDIVQLNLLAELMKKAKISFQCCSNAPMALKLLQEEVFDIVFTDIQMPDIKGYDLVDQIRKLSFPNAATIPIIGFSAGYRWLEKNKKTGFNGFLFKPFKPNDLLKVIQKHTGYPIPTDAKRQEKSKFDFDQILEFMSGDWDASLHILNSFIEETERNLGILELAFEEKDWTSIEQLSHKMSSLMKIISADEIVSLLIGFEKGCKSHEKGVTLLRLIGDKIEEAKANRKILIETATETAEN
jgi:signal transduction histidine kinase/CheY-like chemotaxis protein/HPt (histidine-containing phosphotransfer) domain-containing protein